MHNEATAFTNNTLHFIKIFPVHTNTLLATFYPHLIHCGIINEA